MVKSQAMVPQFVDTAGRPLRMDTAHHAASLSSDEMASWQPPYQSADADLLEEWGTLVARTRDMIRNHGLTSGAVQTHLDNIVGPKLRLVAKPDWRALGLDIQWAREWSRTVESKFRQWADDIDRYCDAGRRLSLTGMITQGYRSFMNAGEMLATAEWLTDRPTKYATAIQMVDPDLLSNPRGVMDSARLRKGVELDKHGAAVGFWFASGWENDPYTFRDPVTWRRVARETPWGRAQVLHVYEQERPGQTRGKGGLVPVLAKMKMLEKFEQTTLQAAILNAMYAATIESSMSWEGVGSALGVDENDQMTSYMANRASWHKSGNVRYNGVKIPHLFPGEQLKLNTPQHPKAEFAQFEEACLRHLAGGLNMSYEQFSRDYTKSNYSSARAAMLESYRFFKSRRHTISGRFARMVYTLWMEEAIDLGEIEIPSGAPNFYQAKTAWTRCNWIGPGRGHIDPLKEANATKVELSSSLTTLEKEAAERGEDWEELLEQRAEEADRMRELGLDPSIVTGITPVPQPAELGEA
jgi:lambda family phage portal protein